MLIQVMIVTVAVILVSSSLFALINQSSERQKERRLRREAVNMIGAIRNQLEDPLLCYRFLRNRQISLAPGGVTTVDMGAGFGSNLAPLGPGWEMPTGIKIREIRVRTMTGPLSQVRMDRPGPPGPTFTKYGIRVYIVPEGLQWNIGDKPGTTDPVFPEYAIDLHANTFNDQIFTCHGPMSTAAVCEAVGGAFDPEEPNPSMYCNPDRRCFPSRMGIVDSPSSCTPPYNNVEWIGVINGGNKYLCSWCNNELNDP